MSLLTYTAFRLDGVVEADSTKKPVTKKNREPLLGHRFAHFQCSGTATKESLPFLIEFFDSCEGCMMVGGKPQAADRPSILIAPHQFNPEAFRFDFTISDPRHLYAARQSLKFYLGA